MAENYKSIFDFMINHKKSSDKKYWIEQFKLDLEEVDCCGRTALQYAVYNNDVELLEILIKSGAKIDAKDDFGLTPLQRAVFWNVLEVTQFLIKSGADLAATDTYGSTVLHQAVLGSALDTARFLLTQKIDHQLINHDGLTPLQLALSKKNTKPVAFAFFSLLDQTDCENKKTSKLKKDFDKKGLNLQAIIDLLTAL